MLSKLIAPKLLGLTVATAVMTFAFIGLVVCFEPPAFMGYVFGALNGANWILLLGLYIHYWEEKSDECYRR